MAGMQAAWGLDVGITSLKAIKLRKDGDKVAVEAFEVIDHDKFLSEPEVDRDDLIRHTLRKFLERNPLHGEMIFVGVPGSSTFARFVKLPPVETKKIPEIVRFEAIQQIPFPLDQVNWDYQTFSNPESPDVEVGIFAMKKELVGQVLANFQSTGMTVHGVQMSPLAVYNAAAYDGLTDGKGSVLIDMGAEHTDLVIMDQGRLWLRTINIGGNHFTDALAKSFKQSFTRAETLKKTAATSKYQKQIFQAMRPIFADLVAEIQRSIGHYNSSHRDSRLERIVGMGNPFKLPNLQKYLQQELKMEVIRLDNFRKATADPKLAAGLNESILSMTSAYGLAVQGLGLATIDTNLLPMEIARQMMWREKRIWFYGAAAVMIVPTVIALTGLLRSNSALAADSDSDQHTRNTKLMAEEAANRTKWNALGDKGDQSQAEQLLKLGSDRAIWPMLSLDFLAALPQAKVAGRSASGAPARNIVLTQISSEYSIRLTAAGSGAPSAEEPGRAGGAAPGGPGIAAPAQPKSDRGFAITIEGYAEPSSGIEVYNIVKTYQRALLDQAKENGDKPYYFVLDGNFSGHIITVPPAGSNMTVNGVWKKDKGDAPFWDEYAAEISGVKPDEKPGLMGAPPEAMPLGILPPVDLFAPRASEAAGPVLLDGCFVFTIKLKVFIKDAPAAPAK